MKTHNLSKVGYGIGLIAIILSIIRYHFTFNDWFKLLAAVGISSLVMLCSYLYSWMRNKDDRDNKQDERLDALATWFVGEEKETIADTARGNKE